MITPDRALDRYLAAALAVAALCLLLTGCLTVTSEKELYPQAVEAAERLRLCMDSVKAEKLERGISLASEDIFQTGMLGEEYNFITTTLGDPAAKRTTANPDMAAMLVFMLEEAGLQAGDTLGCCFSGSFPTLNLAVLCACEVLGIEPVYICSCGASTWGANNPEFSFPEMAALLYSQGLISTAPALVTPGGGDDVGAGVDPELFSQVWERARKLGFPVLEEADFETNVEYKLELLNSRNIDCFLVSGGNVSALGLNMATDSLGQGVLRRSVHSVNEKSGLLERYLYSGKTCILLLNIRRLMADRGMSFDPRSLSEPGQASFYYEPKIPLYIPAAGLVSELAAAFVYLKRRKRHAGN